MFEVNKQSSDYWEIVEKDSGKIWATVEMHGIHRRFRKLVVLGKVVCPATNAKDAVESLYEYVDKQQKLYKQKATEVQTLKELRTDQEREVSRKLTRVIVKLQEEMVDLLPFRDLVLKSAVDYREHFKIEAVTKTYWIVVQKESQQIIGEVKSIPTDTFYEVEKLGLYMQNQFKTTVVDEEDVYNFLNREIEQLKAQCTYYEEEIARVKGQTKWNGRRRSSNILRNKDSLKRTTEQLHALIPTQAADQ